MKVNENLSTKAINNRRGFTILELVIVLALIAILSTLMVSFTAMTSAQVNKTSAYAGFLSDAQAAKNDARRSFAEIDTKDEANRENEHVHSVKISQGILYINNNPLLNVEDYEDIDRISFNIDNTGELLKITLDSDKTGANTTFILTSRTGAQFSEVAE